MTGARVIMFTEKEVAQHSIALSSTLNLATIAYLKEHGHSMDEYWTFVAKRFTPGWAQGMEVDEIVRSIARNVVASGGGIVSMSGDPSSAEAVFVGWPVEAHAEEFGVTIADADTIWGAFELIVDHLGHELEWQRQGQEVRIVVK